MRVTQLAFANWRNFKNVEVALAERVFIFGPNASGKSNLLDSVRFLRDLTTSPGGLQFAVNLRDGVSRLRFLNARRNNMGRVLVAVALGDDSDPKQWEYELHFTRERRARVVAPLVVAEIVRRNGSTI